MLISEKWPESSLIQQKRVKTPRQWLTVQIHQKQEYNICERSESSTVPWPLAVSVQVHGPSSQQKRSNRYDEKVTSRKAFLLRSCPSQRDERAGTAFCRLTWEKTMPTMSEVKDSMLDNWTQTTVPVQVSLQLGEGVKQALGFLWRQCCGSLDWGQFMEVPPGDGANQNPGTKPETEHVSLQIHNRCLSSTLNRNTMSTQNHTAQRAS